MNLSRISIERPTLLAVLFSVLLVFGIISYAFLSYELVPKFTPPVVTVVTIYPGATPQEVEDDVSIIIEDAFSSLANVETIQSTSKESFSLVRMELKAGSDPDLTLQDASRKLQAILGELPPDVNTPTLTRFDFDDLPIMRLGLRSNQDEVAFSRLIRDQIIPEINKISGVAQVKLLGEVTEEVSVNVDPNRLDALGVSLLQVVGAINSANITIPSGAIETLSNRQGVRFSSRFYTLSEIENITVFDNPMLGQSVKLSEVATVSMNRSSHQVITRINGVPSLGLEIKKQGNANAVDIAAEVASVVSELQESNQDIELVIDIAQDTSEFTLAAADAVREDLIIAIILVSQKGDALSDDLG
ncbi:MAG: efflux RND transporter permease subunit, partial [Bacteroidota bacterium]